MLGRSCGARYKVDVGIFVLMSIPKREGLGFFPGKKERAMLDGWHAAPSWGPAGRTGGTRLEAAGSRPVLWVEWNGELGARGWVARLQRCIVLLLKRF